MNVTQSTSSPRPTDLFERWFKDSWNGGKALVRSRNRELTIYEINTARSAFIWALGHRGDEYDQGYDDAREEYFDDAMRYRDLCK